MNFFEHQEQSKKSTFRLLGLFVLAITGIILAIYAAAIGLLYAQNIVETSGDIQFQWFDPVVLLSVIIIVLTIITGGCLVKIMSLRRGGQYIAESLGGRLINPHTKDSEEKKLINVVEEMAIASGFSVPLVYVMDKEKGINAFAAGYSPNSAVVAVTDGCLRRLTRDELQGVVAHEFSHILNGDMRLNIRLIALISGIMIIATVGSIILRSTSRVRKNGMPVLFMGLALIIIGYIGVFVSRIIQSAVSRQREFLADASAVQFTRNPSGIADALKKIGGFSKGSRVLTPLASEASHMFFGSAIKTIFATHPPIVERIQRIEPSFKGDFPVLSTGNSITTLQGSTIMGMAESRPQVSVNPDSVIASIGTVGSDHVQYSLLILQSIPQKIRNELNDPFGASVIIYALLLSNNEKEKALQLESIKYIIPNNTTSHIIDFAKEVRGLDQQLKLPLVDLSMPMLRRMSFEQFKKFKQAITLMIESDGKLNLFEYALQLIITNRLETSFHRPNRQEFKSIEPLMIDTAILISKIAHEGHSDKHEAQKAFETAMRVIPAYQSDHNLIIRPFKDVGVSISRISSASPGVKKTVLDACAHCVLFDSAVSPKEAELLRAIAYSMDLPVPPFLMKK